MEAAVVVMAAFPFVWTFTLKISTISVHGDYGVTVNIEVCGTFDSGSIPDSRPTRGLLF